MFKHIVLATDGSSAAQKACQAAFEMARSMNAKVTAAFVIDPYPYMTLGEDTSNAFQAYMSAALATSAQITSDLEEQVKQAGVTLEKRVIESGDVAASILLVAKETDADLIVMGSHGRTGIERLLLGSVANKVLSMSKLPVLIVR